MTVDNQLGASIQYHKTARLVAEFRQWFSDVDGVAHRKRCAFASPNIRTTAKQQVILYVSAVINTVQPQLLFGLGANI